METMRVIDDEICYKATDCEYHQPISVISFIVILLKFELMSYDFPDLTIHKLFATRADLYRTVYMHPKVKVGM